MELTQKDMQTFARMCGLDPKKSKGQNFLIDDSIVRSIVRESKISKDDTVLEIGPGFGVLTHKLADNAKKVVAVELDDRVITVLEKQMEQYNNVVLVHGDILQTDLSMMDSVYHVVANLPYSITGKVMEYILTAKHKPSTITVMVQKEVAERMCSPDGKKSILAISVQVYGDPEIVLDVPSKSFWPKPKVDSAVVRIDNIHELDLDEKKFFQLVRHGFSSRRKQLGNTLSAGLQVSRKHILDALKECKIKETARAQELSISDWKQLYKVLIK